MPRITERASRSNGLDNLLLGAVIAYSAGKATKDAIQERRRARAEFRAYLAGEQQTQEPVAASVEQTPKRIEATAERSQLLSNASFFKRYFKSPYSNRKLIPREAISHAPWAYSQSPSYRALHADQSERTRPGEYSSGMKYLVALGEKPLRAAVALSKAQNPNEPWLTLVSDASIESSVNRAVDSASAREENNNLVGMVAAIEGMGFDTPDLAFAQWESGDSEFTVVPYDSDNTLHRIVAAGAPVNTYSDPGLMLRRVGSDSEYGRDISVDVRAVDIDQLRAEKAEIIPAVTPDPLQLLGYNTAA